MGTCWMSCGGKPVASRVLSGLGRRRAESPSPNQIIMLVDCGYRSTAPQTYRLAATQMCPLVILPSRNAPGLSHSVCRAATLLGALGQHPFLCLVQLLQPRAFLACGLLLTSSKPAVRRLQLLCLSLSLFLTLTPAPIIRAFVVTWASRITRIISVLRPSFNHPCRVSGRGR